MHTTSVPFLSDPDFATLSIEQRRVIERGVLAAVQGLEGLSVLQRRLLRALSQVLLGLEGVTAHEQPATEAELAEALADVEPAVKQRVVQLMLMLELVLHPLPPEVQAHVDSFARALGVHEDLLAIARDYAGRAYGLALKDFDRKDYFHDWDHRGDLERRMHVHQQLVRPYEVVEHDPVLEAEWRNLEHCAPGTLGRCVWEYYVARGFVFPGCAGSVSPTLAQHDWIHVLADYGTVIDAELEVFGFIGAAIPDPHGFSFLATVVSLFETGDLPESAGGVLQADAGHLDHPGVPERLADALRRGRICHRDVMGGIDYFEYIDLPLDEVRELLGIVPKSPDAIAAGSPSVFEPGGLSEYQRAHGDARYQPVASD